MASTNDVAILEATQNRDITPPTTSKLAEAMLVTPTSHRAQLPINDPTYLDTPTPLRTTTTVPSQPLTKTPSPSPDSTHMLTPTRDTSSDPTSSDPTSSDPTSADPTPESWIPLTTTEISTLPTPDLRQKLTQANALISTLLPLLASARTSAAHSHLQHQLLALHNREVSERHLVETSLAERSIEVLLRDHHTYPTESETQREAARILEVEIQRRRLKRAKRQILDLQTDLSQTKRENESLRRTLREARTRTIANTISASRRQQRELQLASKPEPQQTTPKRFEQTRDRVRMRGPVAVMDERTRLNHKLHDHKLHTLGYLASQVLSQASISPTPTPTAPRYQDAQTSNLMSPVTLFAALSPSSSNLSAETERAAEPNNGEEKRKRKRMSRDSTISVEDSEEIRRSLEEDKAVGGWSPINGRRVVSRDPYPYVP